MNKEIIIAQAKADKKRGLELDPLNPDDLENVMMEYGYDDEELAIYKDAYFGTKAIKEGLNKNELAKFIESSVKDLTEEDYGCAKFDLDGNLAVFVGWSGGWGKELRDDVIQSKENPDYALDCGIRVRNEADWSDFDFLRCPYFEGEGEDLDITYSISPNEDYDALAAQLIKDYEDIKDYDIDSDGKLTKVEEAFSYEDDEFFTREEVDDFAEKVCEHVNETFNEVFDVQESYITNNEIEVVVYNDDLGEFTGKKKVDMRRIRKPSDLDKYVLDIAANIIADIKKVKGVDESLTEASADYLNLIEPSFIKDQANHDFLTREIEKDLDRNVRLAKKSGRCQICGGTLSNMVCQYCGTSYRQNGSNGDHTSVVDALLLKSIEKADPSFKNLSIDDKAEYVYNLFRRTPLAGYNNRYGAEGFLDTKSSILHAYKNQKIVDKPLPEISNSDYIVTEDLTDEDDELLRVVDDLDDKGVAVTDNKEIANKYKQNKNPNFSFDVEIRAGKFYIRASKKNLTEDSDDDGPYSYKETEAELQSLTQNWTREKDQLKCGYDEEKNYGMEILSKHGYECNADKQGGWWIVDYWKDFDSDKKGVRFGKAKKAVDFDPITYDEDVFKPGLIVEFAEDVMYGDAEIVAESELDKYPVTDAEVEEFITKHGFKMSAEDEGMFYIPRGTRAKFIGQFNAGPSWPMFEINGVELEFAGDEPFKVIIIDDSITEATTMRHSWYGSRYTDYNKEDGWTDEDIAKHKEIDWRERNYSDYPIPEDSFTSEAVAYTDNGTKRVKVKFIKFIRSNPIFPPYYAPEKKPFTGVVGPMYDGNKHGSYGIHDRYESQDIYDALSH